MVKMPDFFTSHLVARASATAPLVIAVAFFMGAMAGIDCKAIVSGCPKIDLK